MKKLFSTIILSMIALTSFSQNIDEIVKKQSGLKYKMKLANYIINTDESLEKIEQNINQIIKNLS